MLQDRGDLGIDHGDEGGGVVARAKCILGGAILDLALRRAKNMQLSVAVLVAPEHTGRLGIAEGGPVQLTREGPPAGRTQGPGVSGQGVEGGLARVAFADPEPDVRV